MILVQSETIGIGGGAEAWVGYTQSLRPVQKGLTVCVDMCATAFFKACSVIELLMSEGGFSDSDLRRGFDSQTRRCVPGGPLAHLARTLG